MRTPKLPYVLAAASLLIAGAVAFLVGRYALSDDAPAQAQVAPTGTPVVVEKPPHPSIAARMTAVAEDNAKPRFVGVLNGITFIGEGTPFPEAKIACSNAELRDLYSVEARSALSGSELDFEVTYLPSGFRLVLERATVCGDDVVGVGRVFEGASDSRLSIVRGSGEAVHRAQWPRDRLTVMTIGGREAVVVRSLYGNDLTGVLMHDAKGTTWTITAEMIDEDDVIEIAEGLK